MRATHSFRLAEESTDQVSPLRSPGLSPSPARAIDQSLAPCFREPEPYQAKPKLEHLGPAWPCKPLIPPPQAPICHGSESSPHSQGTLVPTCIRFKEENMICPSPVSRACARTTQRLVQLSQVRLRYCPAFSLSLFHGNDSTDPRSSFSLFVGTDSGQTREVQTRGTRTGIPPGPHQLSRLQRRLDE